jgi:phenylalanyl-tRNA synthetase beta subunit
MGVLHPIVLQNFDWQYPTSAIEINIEQLIQDFK